MATSSPGLKKDNFRVLEDCQPQTITSFGLTDAPITIVVLMNSSQGCMEVGRKCPVLVHRPSFPPESEGPVMALVTFDMKPRTEVYFTQNNRSGTGDFHLYYPGFSESTLFDALLGYKRAG